MLSKSQVDRLGERLKQGALSEEDLRTLDVYRRTASTAYEAVSHRLRQMGFPVTGRPAKATQSILAKLRREKCRLSQIQDIAGCRIVVADAIQQQTAIDLVEQAFPGGRTHDRRKVPSFGYRAVHVVTATSGFPVEIQIRTALQHRWAEFSEKLSDRFGLEVKYGGGSEELRKLLHLSSAAIERHEALEADKPRASPPTSEIEARRQALLDMLTQTAEQLSKE